MRIRKILLVHPTRSTRGLLKKYVFSELGDTEIHEAEGGLKARKMLQSHGFDVVVATDELKDMEIEAFRQIVVSSAANARTPLIVLTESESNHMRDKLVEQGFDRVVQIRVRPADLIHKINAACNPRTWRKDSRYHIPGIKVSIGIRQDRLQATLINISRGGLLVEMATERPDLLLKNNISVSLHLPLAEGRATINDLSCKLLRLEVVEWHSNQTPAVMRATFAFTALEDGPRNKLEELLHMAKEDKLVPEEILH